MVWASWLTSRLKFLFPPIYPFRRVFKYFTVYLSSTWLAFLVILIRCEWKFKKKKTDVCKEFYISLQSFSVSSFILMAVTCRQNSYPWDDIVSSETFQNNQFDFSNVLSSRKDANAKEGTRKKDEQDRKGSKDTKVMTVLVKSTESSYWKL